jgi:hypothetical protein
MSLNSDELRSSAAHFPENSASSAEFVSQNEEFVSPNEGFVSEKEGFVSPKAGFVSLETPSAELPADAAKTEDAAKIHPLAVYGAVKIFSSAVKAEDRTHWLWQGFLARGSITQLTSLWKSGKTTLLAVLLDRMREGGMLIGQPVEKARVVVLSEESEELWHGRAARLTFGDSNTFLCRPFRGKPQPKDWIALIERLVALRDTEG